MLFKWTFYVANTLTNITCIYLLNNYVAIDQFCNTKEDVIVWTNYMDVWSKPI